MQNIEKIREQIKKLWNMRTEAGCTESEMLSFHAKAQAMMDAYQISDADIQEARDEAIKRYDELPGTADVHKIKWHLLHAVGEHCGVQGFRSGRRDAQYLSLIGTPSDIEWARWFLDSMADFVFGALVEHLIISQPPPIEKKTICRVFVEAACQRISERLEELGKASEKQRTSNGRALMVVKGGAIAAFMKANEIHLRCSGGGGGNDNAAARDAGRAAGSRASLGRPVSGPGAALRLT